MKHILIPTDFSDCANAASEFALKTAQLANAKVDFLHLLLTPVDWVKLSLEKEKNYPETKKQIGHAKAELHRWVKKAETNGIEASHSLVFDQGKDEIFKHLEQRHCDFIIMGSHGAKGIKESIIGSNAQKIIRKSDVPVLIIKNQVKHSVKTILFVSDFKDVSKASFHTLTNFADSLNTHIELLFINTPGEFKMSSEIDKNMNNLLTHCHREDSCTKNVVNSSSIENGINEFCSSNQIDLIAICTHGKSSIKQIFSPSVAESLANHLHIPLLSIRI